MTVPGLIVSAPASGTGKTTVTLGLLAAFRAAGVAVAPFKCGPDYIDPAFHAAAAGRESFNLDSFAMAPERLLARTATDAALIVAEGAMGLYDGAAVTPPAEAPPTPSLPPPGGGRRPFAGSGATADIAALTGWPVVLVLDAGGQAQSAGAVARGFDGFRPGVRLAGVILNRVGSPRHEAMLRAGLAEAGIACLGALPRRPDLSLPERHLGLVQAAETGDLPARLAALAALVAGHCDLDAIRAAARPGPLPGQVAPLPPPGQRIALARDAAFSFAYPHLLADWRAAGAEILPFSPLADEPPDPGADVCWLPGGYPELQAGRIAAAGRFLSGLRGFAASRPVHGECGGYMVLGAGLTDAAGTRHAMAGLLGLETSYAARRLHLGYRRARLAAPVPGHAAGAMLVGHEFHYSSVLAQPDAPLAEVTDAAGYPVAETGARRGRVTGTFFHLIGPLA
jgi:cobyrinic acid a,c-diamide synthase